MPTKYTQIHRVSLTAQVPVERAIEIDNVAQRLGITRHRLLILAINAGLPSITQSQAAQQQNQG